MSYETCGNCRYCRVDKVTNTAYCKQTYTETYEDSKACDSFVEDND